MKGRWGVMAMGREMADVQGVDGQGQGGQGGIMARGARGVRRCVEGIARRPTGGRHALVTPPLEGMETFLLTAFLHLQQFDTFQF